jgi:DNA-directed RNA polymerase subunit N (RpoN/RPB10)
MNTIPAPGLCFSCGGELPETDFDNFHSLLHEYISKGMLKDASEKIILDGKLSKPYARRCCRSMFLGDAIEYRRKMALYPTSDLNAPVKRLEHT